MQMDNTDMQILDMLRTDPRVRFSYIASQVHLSQTAVKKRIHKMEDLGIIQGYKTLIDPGRLGYAVHGYMIGGVFKQSLDGLIKSAEDMDEIVRLETIVSGGKEVLIEFYCRDMDHLMDFYKSKIRHYMDSMTVYLVKSTPDKDTVLPVKRDL